MGDKFDFERKSNTSSTRTLLEIILTADIVQYILLRMMMESAFWIKSEWKSNTSASRTLLEIQLVADVVYQEDFFGESR